MRRISVRPEFPAHPVRERVGLTLPVSAENPLPPSDSIRAGHLADKPQIFNIFKTFSNVSPAISPGRGVALFHQTQGALLRSGICGWTRAPLICAWTHFALPFIQSVRLGQLPAGRCLRRCFRGPPARLRLPAPELPEQTFRTLAHPTLSFNRPVSSAESAHSRARIRTLHTAWPNRRNRPVACNLSRFSTHFPFTFR